MDWTERESVLRRQPPQSVAARGLNDLIWNGTLQGSAALPLGYRLFHAYLSQTELPNASREQTGASWEQLVAACLEGDEKRARTLDASAALATRDASGPAEAERLAAQGLFAVCYETPAAAVQRTRALAIHARSHELAYFELLSGLLVARAKRMGGSPIQALRILSALDPVFSEHWRPRLCWERTLAGEVTPQETQRQWAMQVGAQDAEARCFVALMSGSYEDADVQPWREGVVDAPPFGIHLCSEEDRNIWIHVTPTGGQRVTAYAKAGLSNVTALAPPRQGGQRTFLVLARLALAQGMSLGRDVLFEQVFGYPFESRKHNALLRVTMNRVDEMVRDNATIESQDQVFALRLAHPFVFVDPLQARTTEDRVLSVLATAGEWLSAAEIGQRMGIPRRTVVDALQSLELEEICERERRGAAVHFRVEDTTFYEPSVTRLQGFTKPIS